MLPHPLVGILCHSARTCTRTAATAALVCLLGLSLLCRAADSSWSATYSKTTGPLCKDYRSEYYYAANKVMCVSICHHMDDCYGFCFAKATNSCRIHGPHNMLLSSELIAGVRYKLDTSNRDFNGAVAHCNGINGHVAMPLNSDENRRISGLITSDTWLGTTESNDKFRVYTTGEAIPFENFGVFEGLSLGREECAYVKTSETWKDTSCGDTCRVLCQSPGAGLCTATGLDVVSRPPGAEDEGAVDYNCFRKP